MLSRSQWVPKTKFNPPLLVAGDLTRQHLLDFLCQAVPKCRLTLISAPAGSGKTTLAAQFTQKFPGGLCAWLHIGPEDDEPAAFLSSLLTAVQKVAPAFFQDALNLLHSSPNAQIHWRQIAGLFINELTESDLTSLVVIFDDYQHLENSDTHMVCDFLLENMPANLHLVITTRVDPPLPLARLRLRNELAELRLAELRFELTEIKAYLHQKWNLDLSPGEIKNLQKCTEGWVASLHLLALTLKQFPDMKQRAVLIAEFSQSNRLIYELLADEVLTQQPPELRDFLLETSILSDLTPDLCAAVTTNANAPFLLSEVYRRNLFLKAVDDPDQGVAAYRYHELFATFLQRRLIEEHPERLSILHQRAGLAHSDASQQVRHLIAAKLPEQAANSLESICRFELGQRNISHQTRALIMTLPENVRGKRVWLLITLGSYHAQRGQYVDAASYFKQAKALIQSSGDEAAEIELLFDVAWMEGAAGDDLMSAMATKLATVPHLITPAQKASFHCASEWRYCQIGDWPNATDHIRAGINLVLQSSDQGTTSIVVQALGPELIFNDGGLATFKPLMDYLSVRTVSDNWPMLLNLHLMGGWIQYFQGRPDAAENESRVAQKIIDQIGPMGWPDGHVACLELTLLRWQKQFAHMMDRIEIILQGLPSDNVAGYFKEYFLYLQGQAAILQNQMDVAKNSLERLKALEFQSYFGVQTQELAALLEGQICIAETRWVVGEELLSQAAEMQCQVRHTVWNPHPRISLARLYQLQNQPDRALSELRSVLAEVVHFQAPGMLLQEGPTIVPLLRLAVERRLQPDLVEPVLALYNQTEDHPPAVIIPGRAESLSPREMEVLRLLDVGASNHAIAETLFITLRTVKAHVSSILAKLGVKSRGEAVARSHDLHLL